MSRVAVGILQIATLLAAVGCQEARTDASQAGRGVAPPAKPRQDLKTAQVRLLFIGNSHTYMHDLPELVAEMIRFRKPGQTVASQAAGTSFLEDAAKDPACNQLLKDHPWTYVILQAQKISMSGRFNYSRKEGIELAQRAKAAGAAVFFYPEWGLRGKPGDGERQAKVYRDMATAAGVGIAPISQAWDLALAERPKLPLHAEDGNHQSPVGAFLTACVLYGTLTGDSPSALADFSYPAVKPDDRRFLAEIAAQALKTHGTKPPAITPAATPPAASSPASASSPKK